jgi:hypothetical protein
MAQDEKRSTNDANEAEQMCKGCTEAFLGLMKWYADFTADTSEMPLWMRKAAALKAVLCALTNIWRESPKTKLEDLLQLVRVTWDETDPSVGIPVEYRTVDDKKLH